MTPAVTETLNPSGEKTCVTMTTNAVQIDVLQDLLILGNTKTIKIISISFQLRK